MNIYQLKNEIYDANNPKKQCQAAYNMRFVKNNSEIVNILFSACYEAKNVNLQQEAVRSLSVLRPEQALKVFIEKSHNKNDLIRLKSFYHLGTLGNSKGINAVLKGLMDNKPGIRKAAAISAGRLGKDYKTIEALKLVVNQFESYQVRKEAEKSISIIKQKIQNSKKKSQNKRSFNNSNRNSNNFNNNHQYQSYTPIAF